MKKVKAYIVPVTGIFICLIMILLLIRNPRESQNKKIENHQETVTGQAEKEWIERIQIQNQDAVVIIENKEEIKDLFTAAEFKLLEKELRDFLKKEKVAKRILCIPRDKIKPQTMNQEKVFICEFSSNTPEKIQGDYHKENGFSFEWKVKPK